VLAEHAAVFTHNVSTEPCDGAGDHTVAPGARGDYVQPESADASAFDLHLRQGEKAIDRGNPANYASTDFDGNARPAGGLPDAGAIEFGAGPPGASRPTADVPAAGGAISRVRLQRKRICRRARKRCSTRVIVTLVRPARLTVRVWRAGVKRRHPAMVRRRAGTAGRNVIVLHGRRLQRGRYRITVTGDGVKAPRRPRLRVA